MTTQIHQESKKSKKRKTSKEKRAFLVVLPKIVIRGVPEYSEISHYGITQSTTARGATGNLIFRELKGLPEYKAQRVSRILKEYYGGTERYALDLKEGYSGNKLSCDQEEAYNKGLIELCQFIEGTKPTMKRKNPERNMPLAERLLEEHPNILTYQSDKNSDSAYKQSFLFEL